MECAQQHQICHQDRHSNPLYCARPGGKWELEPLLRHSPQSPKLLSLTEWSIMAALTGNDPSDVVEMLGTSSLMSKYRASGGIQSPIPDNQWQLDVGHWVAASLAAIQGMAIDAAIGPSNPNMRRFWAPSESEQQWYLCKNQLSRTANERQRTDIALISLCYTEGVVHCALKLQRL